MGLAVLILFIIYFTLVGSLIYGNFQLQKGEPTSDQKVGVSVIIPFRNEVQNLGELLKALSAQTYPNDLVEFIFINDHSTDAGEKLIAQKGMSDRRFKLIQLTELEGKKAAIERGVGNAKHELILTTDADCVMGKNWLASMIAFYEKYSAHLIIGPVKLQTSNNFIGYLMQTEFVSLISSTSGACGMNRPFMCNGANLLYSKSLFTELNPFHNSLHLASGDDVFLLHSLKKKYPRSAKIYFANHSNALVTAKSTQGFSSFVKQRVRWAQKSKHYEDLSIRLIGGIILGTNAMILVLLLGWIFGRLDFIFLMVFFVLKWSFDFCLLISSRAWLKTPIPIFYSFFLSLIYPFYVIGIALLSLLLQVRWKGRKI